MNISYYSLMQASRLIERHDLPRQALPMYAVFVRKGGIWRQESIPMTSYQEAKEHARRTRKARPFVEMTRVRRLNKS